MNLRSHAAGLLPLLATLSIVEARADTCPTVTDEIATDRPDVTNSSLVIPAGSFQSENGVNFTARRDGQTIDATNTRWRFGIAPCLEFLVDLPTYTARIGGQSTSGFSDISPAVKWQVSPIPGQFDLSLVFGTALPTGSMAIAGPGAQPYLQAPWSWKLHDGWSLSGMFTEFFRPELAVKRVTEATFVVEKEVTKKASVFVEYVGDFQENSGPSHLFNSGAVYRLTPTQQVDLHVAFGLNHNAPTAIVGVGYSFRLDGFFRQPK